MKANYLLKKNILTLLKARGLEQKDLAQWCRRGDSWLSQALNDEERGIPLKYLDRIADFFGLATYQLLQPGISHLTERRSGLDRRQIKDRRISRTIAHADSERQAQPHPREIELVNLFRKLDEEERQKFERAGEYLLLSQRAGATTVARGIASEADREAGSRPPAVRRKLRGSKTPVESV